jgi:hypothetical protein
MKAEIMRVLDDEDDFDVMLGVADHLFGEGWEDA